jgi:hypothetical protein
MVVAKVKPYFFSLLFILEHKFRACSPLRMIAPIEWDLRNCSPA